MLSWWDEQRGKKPLLAGALLALVVFIVYAGALGNGFVYDDSPQIVENPFIQNPHYWWRIFTGSVWSFQGAGAHANFYRPLQFFSYWLIYRLAGPNPAAFHLFHLLLYAATVWLVYQVGRKLFDNEPAAFVAALLWALHPLHVEAVAWISALPDAGFGFFYLLAFLLFLHAETSTHKQAVGHCVAALAYFPALLFKEMAISFPLLLLAYWLFVAARPTGTGWRGWAARWLPYLVAVGTYLAIRKAALDHLTEARHFWKPSLRVFGASVGLLGEHLQLFLWPTHLNVFHTFDLSSSLRSAWPWAALLILVGAIWIRKRQPLLGFLTIWWVVTLIPCLDIRQLSFPLLAERFSYVPSVGLCLAIAFLALLWLPQVLPGANTSRFALSGLALLMLAWGFQTARVIPTWRDNETLLNYSIQQSPDASPLHYSRAVVLEFQHGDLEGATREYETALRLNQASFWPTGSIIYDTYMGLGRIAYRKGRADEAVSYFEKALRFSPKRSDAFDALGSIYFPRGDFARAAEYFAQALKANSYDLGARFYLGTCLMKLGKYRQAAEQFRAATDIDPEYWQAFEAEARALEAAGDAAGAAQARNRARRR